MIRLLPRAEALARVPALAHQVRGVQAHRDPSLPENRERWEGAEEEGRAWWASWTDPAPAGAPPRFAGTLVVGLDGVALDDYPRALGTAVARWMDAAGAAPLVFLPEARLPGFLPDRPVRRGPLAEACRALRGLGVRPGFAGGIVAEGDAAADVVAALFWTARCDPSAGPVHWGAEGAPFAATICQYANVHAETYDASLLARLGRTAEAAGLSRVEAGACDERFSRGPIEGRGLRVE